MFQGKPNFTPCEKVFIGKGKAKRIAYIINVFGIWLNKKGRMAWEGYEYSLVTDQELLKLNPDEVDEKGLSFKKSENEITKCTT